MAKNWVQDFRLSSLEDMYSLPHGLLSAVIQQESRGNPNAEGPMTKEGTAKGAAQFIDKTAKAYGVDDPYDPKQAIPAMARMFGDLNKQYAGDLDKMLAGYNWGSGNMAKYGMEKMPAETRDYIGQVRGFMPAGKQYAQADTGTMNDASRVDPSALEAEMRKRGLAGSAAAPDAATVEAEMQRRGLKQPRGAYDKLSTGIYAGLTKRGIGIIQTLDAMTGKNMLSDEARAAAQRATANINADTKGTGVIGGVGELAGDPVNWMNPGKNLVAAGAKIGAASSGTAASERDLGVGDRLADAGVGAGVGGATGYIVPKVAGSVADAAIGISDRVLASFGSVKAAERIVYRNYAEKMLKDGFTPEEVAAKLKQAKATGLDPTLAEATGSRGVMKYEKKLASGAGEAGTTFNENLAERGNTTIPGVVNQRADALIGAPGAVDDAYASATSEGNQKIADSIVPEGGPRMIEPPGGANADPQLLVKLVDAWRGMRAGIDQRLGELGSVNNVETQALRQAKTILDNAESRGGSFQSILDAKKQLDNLYIEGGNQTVQKQANRHVTQHVKQLDDILTELAPTNYPPAKTMAKSRMAGRDMQQIADDTAQNGGSQLLTRLTDPTFRADFLEKLPDDAARANYQGFFDTLDRIRRGFGGRERSVGMDNSLEKSVIGIDPGLGNPLGWGARAIRYLGEKFTPEVYNAATEASWNPNVEKLAGQMTKQTEGTAMGRQAGMVAAGQAAQGETTPRAPDQNHSPLVNMFMNALGLGEPSNGTMTTPEAASPTRGPTKITITPQDKLPAPEVNLPSAGPQSMNEIPTSGGLPPLAKLYARFLNNDYAQQGGSFYG